MVVFVPEQLKMEHEHEAREGGRGRRTLAHQPQMDFRSFMHSEHIEWLQHARRRASSSDALRGRIHGDATMRGEGEWLKAGDSRGVEVCGVIFNCVLGVFQ